MNTYNGVPAKISPDYLVDAIVEIQISTDYKSEKVEQFILDSIKNNFPRTTFRKYPLMGSDRGKHVWADDVFRLYVCENVISVNIVGKYPGWANMLGFIKGALQSCYESKIEIIRFLQVRINYVSHIPDISIFDVWDGTPVKLNNIPPFIGREFNFKFGIYQGTNKEDGGEYVANAIVHLSDNLPITDSKSRYSRIDIGIESVSCDGSWADAYEKLRIVHFHEKEIFFRILSEEFVNKLNPIWR